METIEKKSTSNSLMKKTKVQLVDIILRKDDIERKLREEIKGKDNFIGDCLKRIESNKVDISTLKNEYAEMCDNMFSDNSILTGRIKKIKKRYNLTIAILVILFGLFMCIF